MFNSKFRLIKVDLTANISQNKMNPNKYFIAIIFCIKHPCLKFHKKKKSSLYFLKGYSLIKLRNKKKLKLLKLTIPIKVNIIFPTIKAILFFLFSYKKLFKSQNKIKTRKCLTHFIINFFLLASENHYKLLI